MVLENKKHVIFLCLQTTCEDIVLNERSSTVNIIDIIPRGTEVVTDGILNRAISFVLCYSKEENSEIRQYILSIQKI